MNNFPNATASTFAARLCCAIAVDSAALDLAYRRVASRCRCSPTNCRNPCCSGGIRLTDLRWAKAMYAMRSQLGAEAFRKATAQRSFGDAARAA
jgi:hypothetical protein